MHDIAYSHSNDLTERHVIDKILAEKARKCIIARNSTLGERTAAAAVWAAMKAKTKIGMGMKKKTAKKTAKKRVFPTAKWWYIANVGRARIINRCSGRRGKGGQRQQSHTMPARGVATLQSRDGRSRIVPCSIQIWKGIISLPVRGQGVITKKKKKRRKNIKNACGCDNEHTVGSTGKTHACTIF